MTSVDPALLRNSEELRSRQVYLTHKGNYCHAGGFSRYQLHVNYGLPCVAGTMYREDGSSFHVTNCVYCGREFSSLHSSTL